MVAITGSVLTGIGSVVSAIGGIFGKKPKAAKLDLGHLRAQAEAHGFNPLTVLRSTGGAGFHTGGSAGSQSALAYIGQAIGGAGIALQGYEDRQIAIKEAEARISAMTSLSANSTRSVTSVPRASRIPPVTVQSRPPVQDNSPYLGVDVSAIPFEEVRSMNGQTFRMRADVLDALGKKPGDTIITGDVEELLGEVGGELHGAGAVIDDGLGIGDPWMITTGGRTPAEKKADRANPSNTSTKDGAIVPLRIEIDPQPGFDKTLLEDDPWLLEWQQ